MTTNGDTPDCDGDVKWTVENEVHLFESIIGYKPVGVNKHFHMLSLLNKFCELSHSEVNSADLWQKLSQLYDLSLLDEMEEVPFPNGTVDFALPDAEFQSLVRQRQAGPVGGASEQMTSSQTTPTDTDTPVRRAHSNSSQTEAASSARASRRASDASDVTLSQSGAGRRLSRRVSLAAGAKTSGATSTPSTPTATPPPPAAKRARRV